MRPFEASRFAFETTTGAATTMFFVKTAAAEAGTSLVSMARANAPVFFRPQAGAAKQDPSGRAASAWAWVHESGSAGTGPLSPMGHPIFRALEYWFVGNDGLSRAPG